MPNHPDLDFLIHLASRSGAILREGFGKEHQIDYKSAIDIVTEVDHRSEAYLLGEIRRQFPEHRIISEETGLVQGKDCCVWYIDPLDGTVNYAHHIPIFAVSIAYVAEGQIKLGVIYEPLRDECFTAEAGKGARLNDRPIQCSKTSEMEQALLVTGFSYDVRTNPVNNLDWFAYFTLRSRGVRRIGSAAVDLGYIAAGRFDGYWELQLGSYDIAAGALIAAEAGATVTSIRGMADFLTPPASILAATPAIHDQLLQAFIGGRAE